MHGPRRASENSDGGKSCQGWGNKTYDTPSRLTPLPPVALELPVDEAGEGSSDPIAVRPCTGGLLDAATGCHPLDH
jgi:hypothetical protein